MLKNAIPPDFLIYIALIRQNFIFTQNQNQMALSENEVKDVTFSFKELLQNILLNE